MGPGRLGSDRPAVEAAVEVADLDVPKNLPEGEEFYRFAIAIDSVTITYEVEQDRRALIRGLKGLVAAVKAA